MADQQQQATTEDAPAGAVAVRSKSFDLTRAPWQQWNAEMVDLAKRTVLRDAKSNAEVYFCLALADSLDLNPIAGEVYFIRQRSKDGDGGGRVVPYVGREGLVKKATQRDAWFDSDTVREKDKFRVAKKADGTRVITHSYTGTAEQRGPIVGAWAELHFRDGSRPGYFYAELSEFLPTFDQQWKMEKSPWGNQRSAMIEKCAMIGAARQRLNLAGVLVDAELDRVMAQATGAGAGGPGEGASETAAGFDFSALPETIAPRLAAAVAEALSHDPLSWPATRCEMVFSGQSIERLTALAEQIEHANAEARAEGPVVDAEVVDAELSPEQHERVEMLRHRLADLQAARDEAPAGTEQDAQLAAEMDQVEAEMRSITGGAPGQGDLGV